MTSLSYTYYYMQPRYKVNTKNHVFFILAFFTEIFQGNFFFLSFFIYSPPDLHAIDTTRRSLKPIL